MPDEIDPEDAAEVAGRGMGDPSKIRLDMFHPLDHWPWQKRCREFYGGPRNHLSLTWTYRRKNQLIGLLARWTTCLVGRHRWDIWKRGGIDTLRQIREPGDYQAICRYCHSGRTATEDEWW